MKILLLSYAFPPFGGAGVQRISKLAEYLVRGGHSVSVVTHNTGFVQDADLLSESLKSVNVFRLDFSEDKFHGYVNWPPEFKKFIFQCNPDIVLSSSPTMEVHFFAKVIKSVCSACWIADFRDIQSEYVMRFNLLALHKIKKIEREIVESCDAVVVISEYHKRYLSRNFSLDARKVTVVMNGYDASDFLGASKDHYDILKSRTPTLTLVHVGTFYGKRSPFFLIINSIIAKKTLGIDLRLRLVGKMGRASRFITNTFSRFIGIEVEDSVSHANAIQIMCNADVLILVPGWFGVGVLTGKVFEYVASGSPIINLYAYKGPLTDMLEKVEGAHNVREFDFNKFSKTIFAVLNESRMREYDRSSFTKFERNNQYKMLEVLMLNLSRNNSGNRE